ncbi:hypothetical protein CEXT_138581 [Caerostris extrusa]|uniref:Uncharacterized protein n=1 Tax=Caerostris extrusa TaxID=172846 RepID=A0AAV4VPX5_CAEEX|nr:hypothetical protein CEXT_138581 [Caerostris extrusa]
MYVTPDDISAPEKHRCGLLPTHAIARDWDLSSAVPTTMISMRVTTSCPVAELSVFMQFGIHGTTGPYCPSRKADKATVAVLRTDGVDIENGWLVCYLDFICNCSSKVASLWVVAFLF